MFRASRTKRKQETSWKCGSRFPRKSSRPQLAARFIFAQAEGGRGPGPRPRQLLSEVPAAGRRAKPRSHTELLAESWARTAALGAARARHHRCRKCPVPGGRVLHRADSPWCCKETKPAAGRRGPAEGSICCVVWRSRGRQRPRLPLARPGAARPDHSHGLRVPPAIPQPTPSPAGSRRSGLGGAQAHSAPAPPTWLRWCRLSCGGRAGEDAEPPGSRRRRRCSRGVEARDGPLSAMARLADYFIVVGYDHEKTGRCGCAQGCSAVLASSPLPSLLPGPGPLPPPAGPREEETGAHTAPGPRRGEQGTRGRRRRPPPARGTAGWEPREGEALFPEAEWDGEEAGGLLSRPGRGTSGRRGGLASARRPQPTPGRPRPRSPSPLLAAALLSSSGAATNGAWGPARQPAASPAGTAGALLRASFPSDLHRKQRYRLLAPVFFVLLAEARTHAATKESEDSGKRQGFWLFQLGVCSFSVNR